MKATILDLRYKMKQVLGALERNEKVTIMYHGKEKGIITPLNPEPDLTVEEHSFFGLRKGKVDVSKEIDDLRQPRYL